MPSRGRARVASCVYTRAEINVRRLGSRCTAGDKFAILRANSYCEKEEKKEERAEEPKETDYIGQQFSRAPLRVSPEY